MEPKTRKVTIAGEVREYPDGCCYADIVKDYQEGMDAPILLVKVNGKLRELHKHLNKDCSLEFVTVRDSIGHKTYKRSACLILFKAIYDVAGKENVEKVVLHFSVGDGYFLTMTGRQSVSQEFLAQVKKRMDEIVEAKIPIVKRSVDTADAIELFHRHHMYDKERLFQYRRSSKVNVYSIENFEDYFYGFMAYHTGFIPYFELYPYDDGFVLQLPTRKEPGKIPPFEPSHKIFQVQKESENWGEMLQISTVGELNDRDYQGRNPACTVDSGGAPGGKAVKPGRTDSSSRK